MWKNACNYFNTQSVFSLHGTSFVSGVFSSLFFPIFFQCFQDMLDNYSFLFFKYVKAVIFSINRFFANSTSDHRLSANKSHIGHPMSRTADDTLCQAT